MTCGRCGSINIVRSRSSAFDKFVRLFTNRKRVTCRRCLWTDRIEWNEDDDYVPVAPKLRAGDNPSTEPRRAPTDSR
jgi:hypothetical protein